MARVVALIVTVVLASWPARAEASFLSWLEELSGPGPFHGVMVMVPVKCIRGDARSGCGSGDSLTEATLGLRIGAFRSDPDRPRFQDLDEKADDNRGAVSVVPVSLLYVAHLHRSLEVGAGAGFMRVSGSGFDAFYRVTVTPVSAAFAPAALHPAWSRSPWSRFVRLEADITGVPQGFRGRDFGNARTRYDSGFEFLGRYGVLLDLSAFFGGRPVIR